jgi:GTP pyrophosphokinase/guanosine-3',5'-bis(diphosphate) 3'-pyrophosphohydrolase
VKINGDPATLRTELRSGDVVEVSTSPSARPNPAWLNFARTGRARSKIRHYLKNLEHEESEALGLKMLSQALRAEGLELPPHDLAPGAAAGTGASSLTSQTQSSRSFSLPKPSRN